MLWSAWLAALLGLPRALIAWLQHNAPAFHPSFHPIAAAVAAVVTAVWLMIEFLVSGREGTHVFVHWTAGLTLFWALTMFLWLPYLDSTRSYKDMLADLKAALPARHTQIGWLHLYRKR